ncbi:MAG: lipase [Actinomycetales bacterium]|nr:lipase [Actinomycetales bacterium]
MISWAPSLHRSTTLRRAVGVAASVCLVVGLANGPATGITGAGTASASPATDPGHPLAPPPVEEVLNPWTERAIRDGRPATIDENLRGIWGPPGQFFDEPSPLPDVPVGTLLKSEPFQVIFNGFVPAHVRAWRMMYVTEDVRGDRVVSTGIILLPEDGRDDAGRPVIALQETNDSAAPRCHPSSQWSGGAIGDASGIFAVGPLMQMLGAGAAVVISDIGNDAAPGVHGVFAGRYAGMALLNGLRAAYQVPGPQVNPRNEVGVFGVAGGGVGAAFALEYQPWYAPELTISATVLEALAVDQRNFVDFADGHLGSGFVLGLLVGLEAQYPELNLDEHLNPAGKALADVFRATCQTPTYFSTPFLPHSVLYEDGIRPADRAEFQEVYRVNSLGRNNPAHDPALRPPGRILVSSCARDDSFMVVTPAADARWLADTYRSQGADVHYQGLDCGNDVLLSDPYKWGTELFGMHTVSWLLDEIR